MRRGVFIDAQNIYLSAKQDFPEFHIEMEYQYLKEFFKDDAVTTFTMFYRYNPDDKRQMKFIMAVADLGFRVVAKPIKKLGNNIIKADIDMDMALEILDQAPFLDEVVILSGDSDFVSLIDRLARMGKKVIVIGPDRYTANELVQACHEFIRISKIPNFLKLTPKPTSPEKQTEE
jgi:uncharacterized LabA/DUF88 family protein